MCKELIKIDKISSLRNELVKYLSLRKEINKDFILALGTSKIVIY